MGSPKCKSTQTFLLFFPKLGGEQMQSPCPWSWLVVPACPHPTLGAEGGKGRVDVACTVWRSPREGAPRQRRSYGGGGAPAWTLRARQPLLTLPPHRRAQVSERPDRSPPLCRAAKHPRSPVTALIQPFVLLPGESPETRPTWGFGNMVAGARVCTVGFPRGQGL